MYEHKFFHFLLQFASGAKKISNKPVVNEVMDDKALIRKHEKRIKFLEKKLDEAEKAGKEVSRIGQGSSCLHYVWQQLFRGC